MIVEVLEDIASQSLTVEWEGGTQTFIRKFFVFPRDGGTGTWGGTDSVLSTLAATPHFVAVGLPYPVGSTATGRLICRSIDLTPMQGQLGYNVTATYTSLLRFEGQGPVFAEPSMSASVRTVDLYRLNVSVPTDGDASGTADMGGSPIDEAGKPYSWPIRQMEMSIDILWDASDYFPVWTDFAGLVNQRNDAEFLGFPVGSLLFTGVSFAPKHYGWYSVTFKFLWDQLKHCEQRPQLDVDGRPLLTGMGGIGNAAAVYWFQPYADKFDFWDFFSTDEKAWLERAPPP